MIRRVWVVLPLALLAQTVAAGAVEPIRDVNVGPAVTIEAPATYGVGIPFEVRGRLYAQVGLPVVFETAQPVRDQRIDVLVGDAVAGSAITDAEGAYHVTLTFGAAQPTTRFVRAVAFNGTALETSSRTVAVSVERLYTSLRVEPASVSLDAGNAAQLRAIGLDDDGRQTDLTGEVTWSSSDAQVASVSGGLVTAVSPGTTTITAAYQTLTDTSTVTVL